MENQLEEETKNEMGVVKIFQKYQMNHFHLLTLFRQIF
jgi:hypothetical protein